MHKIKAVLLGNLVLQLFNVFADKFDDATVVHVDHMVVMDVIRKLIDRVAVVEIMATNDARRFELRKDSINRRESDSVVRVNQLFVDILGAHMARFGALQNF